MIDRSEFIRLAFDEDIGTGDHTSHACIPADAIGKAKLLVKENGIIAGVELAAQLIHAFDPNITFSKNVNDGERVTKGDVVFTLTGPGRSILSCERLVLNLMQRMSGIASTTSLYVNKIKDYPAKVLDTRKTTPLLRSFEKEAVRIGGGFNHRMGLYDMILIKDNHVDYCGGIKAALQNVTAYCKEKKLDLPVEIETRNMHELNQVLEHGGVNRIMLDNFPPNLLKEAVELIDGRFETEASGGIDINNIESYAKTGVDFISVGALTHSVKSLDLSLKAIKDENS